MSAGARVALVVLAASVAPCRGHAYLSDPPARNTLRPVDNCPHCMQSGGPDAVKARAGGAWPSISAPGSHGLCGDPVQGREAYASLAEEPFMVPGFPIETFTAGTTVTFKVAIAAHHQGHFEFRVCEHALDGSSGETAEEAQRCLNQWVLRRAPPPATCTVNDFDPDCQPVDEAHPERWYLPPAGYHTLAADSDNALEVDQTATGMWATEVYGMRYEIPEGLTCEHCTLQFYWATGNTCLYDEDYFAYFHRFEELGWDAAAWSPLTMASWSTCEVSCCGDASGRYPEEFWNCADVAIRSAGGGAGPGSAPRTTPNPTAPTTAGPGSASRTTPNPTAPTTPNPLIGDLGGRATTTQAPAPAPSTTAGPGAPSTSAEPEPQPEPAPTPAPPASERAAVSSGDLVFLRAHDGGRLSVEADDNDVIHTHLHPDAQTFVVEKDGGGGAIVSGDSVFLRVNSTSKMLTVEPDGTVHARWEHRGSWQSLVVEKLTGGGAIHMNDNITLRAHMGNYIYVEHRDVHATAGDHGALQRLTIESAVTWTSATCQRNDDCAANAWCQDDAYYQWCSHQGQAGHCPEPMCVWRPASALIASASAAHQAEPAGVAGAARRRRRSIRGIHIHRVA